MIRTIIWLILFWIICTVIWYAVWVSDRDDDQEAKDIAYEALQDYCNKLEKDNIEFMKYVPLVIRKKDMIVMMRKMWKSFKEISDYTGVDKSWICKMYKRWKREGSISV